MVSWPLDSGRGEMWSTDICSKGDVAGGNGWSNPLGFFLQSLNHWHSGQCFTYWATSLSFPSQETSAKFLMVWAIPGCPERMWSWASAIIWRQVLLLVMIQANFSEEESGNQISFRSMVIILSCFMSSRSRMGECERASTMTLWDPFTYAITIWKSASSILHQACQYERFWAL